MDGESNAREERTPAYAWYVLGVLFLVYALNFIDRQIITILAPDLRRDLGLTHSDIGFLYGTAFGVFYALFGIPLGRLADSWHRVRLLTVALALWSAMTALSGFARNAFHLTAARIGVGVGEASASPTAYSLLSDWFPKKRRATALAIYSAGIYVGGGFSLFAGGKIVEAWNAAYPGGGPFGLVGWQAAYLAVGLPGLLMALWVITLREPLRGQSEGLIAPRHPAPFKGFFEELVTIIPPFTLIGAARGGTGPLIRNLIVAAVIAATVWLLIRLGESPAQWIAVGIGIYAVFSWSAALKRRDLPTWTLIIGTPAFLAVVIAYGLNSFLSYAATGMAPSFAQQVHHVSPSEAGLWLGGPGMLSGFLGVTLGGVIADRLRQRYAWGRIAVILFGAVAPIPPLIIAFTAVDKWVFYAVIPFAQVFSSCALGSAAAATQDLVLPRMRGAATGAFFIGTTLLGLACGPYLAGRVADLNGGDLGFGVLSLLVTAPIAVTAGLLALKWVPKAEATREERARAAGEAI